MTFSFKSKAHNLEQLSGKLKSCKILPLSYISVKDWNQNQDTCLAKIANDLKNETEYIVRSSGAAEDHHESSMAGVFETIHKVKADKESLKIAINQVIKSFLNPKAEDQILIQPYLNNIQASGVLLTRDLDTLSPYYILNIDDSTTDTESVTSGKTNNLRTIIKFFNKKNDETEFAKIFDAADELISFTKHDNLDIEFALDNKSELFLFQVRPLVIGKNNLCTRVDAAVFMDKAHRKIQKILSPHPYLAGEHGILGVMPDWNPAEMIGIKPRPLAFSLYKYFITDQTWAYQRDNYGYRNLRSFPLIHNILGLPYVDVRVSFNSFIPKNLDEKIASKLVNHYLTKLRSIPAHHDKVEFDIVYSCYFFNIDEKFQELKNKNFSALECAEIKKSLFQLTENILQPNGIFYKDIEKIKDLEKRQLIIEQSELPILDKIFWFGEDCKRYGTLPFAGLARAAFIAVQLLNSLVEAEILTQEDQQNFMGSLKTVAKEMANDRKKLSKENFINKYGHLRPGTYDILVESYKNNFDFYFSGLSDHHHGSSEYSFPKEKLTKIDEILKKHNFTLNATELLHFIKEAIEHREYSKFIFTQSVSHILELIKELGQKYQLDKEELSYLNVQTIIQLYGNLEARELQEIIKENISFNKNKYQTTKLLRLPPLITEANDIFYYELEKGSPNFITLEKCQGTNIREQDLKPGVSLKGKIVFIKSADPGYDWLFTHSPAGFVTMYGGANSHMAIRAAELKIPAIIGCGEKNYNQWSKAAMLEIDCAKKIVTILK